MNKLKPCKKCLKLSVIWKAGLCLKCSYQERGKVVKINQFSEKRAEDNVEYLKLRLEYLNEHKKCEIAIPGICKGYATDIHHSYSGKDRNHYFLDTTTWFATDRPCHSWVHLNPLKARELGFLK